MSTPTEHTWFQQQIAAYLAGGLHAEDLPRFQQHESACPDCAARLAELRKLDVDLSAAFQPIRPAEDFEDRLIARLHGRSMPWRGHPMLWKITSGIAAAIVLGATGYASMDWLNPHGRNPLLASNRGEITPEIFQAKSTAPASPNGNASSREAIRLKAETDEIAQRFSDAQQRFATDIGLNNFDMARSEISDMQRTRNADPGVLNADVLARVDSDLAQARTQLDAKRADYDAQQSKAGQAQAKQNENERLRKIQVEKDAEVGALVDQTKKQIDAQNYEGAMGLIDEIKVLDPKNDFANTVSTLVNDKAILQEQQKFHEKFDYNFSKQINNAQGAQVAYSDVYRFPTNWPEISDLTAPLSNAQAPKADYFTLKGNAGKFGTGTLTISGNNTYTGGTALSSGMLTLNGGTATYYDALKGTEGTFQLGDKTDLRSAIAAGNPAKPLPQPLAVVNGTSAAPVPPPAENPAAQRKIIRHGEVTFEVDNFDSAVMQITKIVIEENGFVATTSSDKLANGKVTGAITVRVPPDNLDVLVLKLRGLGDLKGQKIGADDVTKDYTDLESELLAAKAMEDRLLDIIKTGKGEVKDLVEAEKELGVWREKVEHVTGEINYYNNLISLSTLNITLNEKDIRQAALATETETVNAGIEAEDVGKARQDLLKVIDDAKGRIIQSDLKAFDAGQLAAVVVADVPGEAAGPVLDRLKQLGRVARLDVGRAQTTASGQPPIVGAHVERQPTRFSVNIYNLANVAPRQTTNFGLAADDVEKTYHDIIQRITKAGGRVVTSSLNRAKADQVSAAINFESPDTAAAALLADVRTLGEVLNLAVTENPDAANTTNAKHGFTLSLVSLSALGARESIDRAIAVNDVSKAYNDILTAAGQAKARITQQQLDESHRQAVVGRLSLVVGRDQLDTVEKAITDNHAGIVSRTQSRVTDDNNTTDSKVELRLLICNVDQLPPRQTTTVNLESTDPEKAGGDLQAAAVAASGRVVEQSLSTDGASRMHVVIDVPLKKSGEMLDHVRGMGTVKRIDQTRDTSIPDADFVHARLDVTFATINPIVADDTGLASTLRSGLSTSIRGLLFSLEFIIIGLCLVLPWALVAWVGWKLFRRGKRTEAKPA